MHAIAMNGIVKDNKGVLIVLITIYKYPSVLGTNDQNTELHLKYQVDSYNARALFCSIRKMPFKVVSLPLQVYSFP